MEKVEESIENGDGYTLEISLEKDPKSGLGLTLVDGNLNGIKGVYVKSVSEGGAGKRGVGFFPGAFFLPSFFCS